MTRVVALLLLVFTLALPAAAAAQSEPFAKEPAASQKAEGSKPKADAKAKGQKGEEQPATPAPAPPAPQVDDGEGLWSGLTDWALTWLPLIFMGLIVVLI